MKIQIARPLQGGRWGTILLVLVATFVFTPAVRADTIYAFDSSRTQLNNDSGGADPRVDDVRSDSSKLTARGDAKAQKSWIEFDISNVDVGSLTNAELRITLHQDKDGSALLSAVNDDVTSGSVALDGTVTWNTAPGNITSTDGINPDDGSFSVDDLRLNLDPNLTTLIGTVEYPGGSAGDQYFMDVLPILQADTDGIVLFALHGASGSTNFSTHDHPNGEEFFPALVLTVVPEPTSCAMLGVMIATVMLVRRSR